MDGNSKDGVLKELKEEDAGNIDKTKEYLNSQRVFKKSSPNAKLTLYLSSRDLIVSSGKIDKLHGVLLVDTDFLDNRKVFGRITLTFRYGREDEEVMGLKFCNEAIMCLAQLYPVHPNLSLDEHTPLQDTLVKRLGPNAFPFNLEITPLAPPSVQLLPAKEYNGAPIGTSYDVRVYVAERADEKFTKHSTVRMGIRVIQRAYAPPSPSLFAPSTDRKRQRAKVSASPCTSSRRSLGRPETRDKENIEEEDLDRTYNGNDARTQPENDKLVVSFKNFLNGHDGDSWNQLNKMQSEMNYLNENEINEDSISTEHEEHYRSLCGSKRPSLAAYLANVPAPRASIEKPFLLSDGRIHLSASLDKGIYSHGEEVKVNVHIRNFSNKTIRKIKVFVVQHVDVCMFSNGKFKNVVAMINAKDEPPLNPDTVFNKTFSLLPTKSTTKNWIALEDSYTKSGSSLSSSVSPLPDNAEDRNVFAIYVSYYVKIKLMLSVMGGQVSLKLPFTLMHTCNDTEHLECVKLPIVPIDKIDEMDSTYPVAMPSPVKPEKDGT